MLGLRGETTTMEALLVLGLCAYLLHKFGFNGLGDGRSSGSSALHYEDNRGYLRYTADNRLVHRVVAEQKLGRRLRPEEVVHHRDRNKRNNDPRNLWVFKNQAEHQAQHERDALKYGEYWSYNCSRR